MFRYFFLMLIVLSTLLIQCGSDPNLDKTAYLMKKKIGLTSEQTAKFDNVINDVKKIREQDRNQHRGNDKALLKAAREREALEIQRLESVLEENQKTKFRKLWSKKKVSDRALLLGERIGLNRKVTIRINPIISGAPVKEDFIKAKNSGDPSLVNELRKKADKVHKEIEHFLNDEQKIVFRKLIEGRCGH